MAEKLKGEKKVEEIRLNHLMHEESPLVHVIVS